MMNETRRAELAQTIRSILAIKYINRTPEQSAAVDSARAELWAMFGQPATLPVTINGETRELEVYWNRPDFASTKKAVAFAKVGRSGSKLWPVQVDLFVNDQGRLSQNSDVRVAGQRSGGRIVSWADDARVRETSVSASIHANGERAEESRAKSSATRKANRGEAR